MRRSRLLKLRVRVGRPVKGHVHLVAPFGKVGLIFAPFRCDQCTHAVIGGNALRENDAAYREVIGEHHALQDFQLEAFFSKNAGKRRLQRPNNLRNYTRLDPRRRNFLLQHIDHYQRRILTLRSLREVIDRVVVRPVVQRTRELVRKAMRDRFEWF